MRQTDASYKSKKIKQRSPEDIKNRSKRQDASRQSNNLWIASEDDFQKLSKHANMPAVFNPNRSLNLTAQKGDGNITPSSDNTHDADAQRQHFKLPEPEVDDKNMTFADNVKFSIDVKKKGKMKHSPSFYNERKKSVDAFRDKLDQNRKKSPEQVSIKEYQNKIFQRLDYIRQKRRSFATQEHIAGDEMFKNVIGAAVGYKEALEINQSSAK